MNVPVRPDADPGWKPLLAGQVAGRLSALRLVFAAVVIGVLILAAVALVLDRSGDREPSGGSGTVLLVAAVGAMALGVGEVVGRRRLDCGSDAALANSYTARSFLRMAVAESPALVGFAGALVWARLDVFLAGAAFALVALFRAAPTVGRVASETERLRSEGCGRDLRGALQSASGGVS